MKKRPNVSRNAANHNRGLPGEAKREGRFVLHWVAPTAQLIDSPLKEVRPGLFWRM